MRLSRTLTALTAAAALTLAGCTSDASDDEQPEETPAEETEGAAGDDSETDEDAEELTDHGQLEEGSVGGDDADLMDVAPVRFASAAIGDDRQTVTVTWWSATDCAGLDRADLDYSDEFVHITLYEGTLAGTDGCDTSAEQRQLTFELDEPLGDRRLRDGAPNDAPGTTEESVTNQANDAGTGSDADTDEDAGEPEADDEDDRDAPEADDENADS